LGNAITDGFVLDFYSVILWFCNLPVLKV